MDSNSPSGMPGSQPLGGGSPLFAPVPDPSDQKRGKKDKKVKAAKPAKDKRVKTAREKARVNGLLATVLAVLAVLGSIVALRQPEDPKAFVAVAKETLMPGEVVTAEQISIIEMPQLYIEPGAAWSTTDADVLALLTGERQARIGADETADWSVIGRRPKHLILAGQQIHPDPLFTDVIELVEPLGDDERLVTVTLAADRALLGTLRSGDRIDIYVYAADERSDIGTPIVTYTVPVDDPFAVPNIIPDLNKVRVIVEQAEVVLARNAGALEGSARASDVPNVFVLRVSADEAVQLIAADGAATRMYALYRDPSNTESVLKDLPATVAPNASDIDPMDSDTSFSWGFEMDEDVAGGFEAPVDASDGDTSADGGDEMGTVDNGMDDGAQEDAQGVVDDQQ